MIVFITSFMVSTIDDASVLGLPKIVNEIFLGSDVAVISCTIVFGQLIAQINCAHFMLDFINNWGMVFSTYVALCVEASGILHAVFFVQIIFTKIVEIRKQQITSNIVVNDLEAANIDNTGNTSSNSSKKGSTTTLNTSLDSCTTGRSSSINSDSEDSASSDGCASMNFDVSNNNNNSDDDDEEQQQQREQRPWWQRVFFWARVVFSLAISIFAIVVFSTAILTGNTTIRDSIPPVVSFLSLLMLLILGGFMEALQIALFAVKHVPAEHIEANPRAKRNCDYILGSSNNNNNHDDTDEESSRLQAFLVGRQIAQTVIMFMIARIITVEMKTPNTTTLFGVSPQLQTILFDSGLLNALVSTIFASLSWRVTANFFPMLYLGSPCSIWIIRLCLIVEGTGMCAAAWTLEKNPAYLIGYQKDTDYLTVIDEVDQQSQEVGGCSSFTNSENSESREKDVEQGCTGGNDNHKEGKAPTNVTIVNDDECQ